MASQDQYKGNNKEGEVIRKKLSASKNILRLGRSKNHTLLSRHKKKWTRAEEAMLRNDWGDFTILTMCNRLGRSVKSVLQKAYFLGLPGGIPQGCISIKEAARVFGFAPKTMSRVFKTMKVRPKVWVGAKNEGKSTHVRRFVNFDAAKLAVSTYVRTWETGKAASKRLRVHRVTLTRAARIAGHSSAVVRLPDREWDKIRSSSYFDEAKKSMYAERRARVALKRINASSARRDRSTNPTGGTEVQATA